MKTWRRSHSSSLWRNLRRLVKLYGNIKKSSFSAWWQPAKNIWLTENMQPHSGHVNIKGSNSMQDSAMPTMRWQWHIPFWHKERPAIRDGTHTPSNWQIRFGNAHWMRDVSIQNRMCFLPPPTVLLLLSFTFTGTWGSYHDNPTGLLFLMHACWMQLHDSCTARTTLELPPGLSYWLPCHCCLVPLHAYRERGDNLPTQLKRCHF